MGKSFSILPRGRQSRAGERRSALQRALWRVPRNVSVPLAAVLAIYARENGAGTMFEPEAAYDEDVSSLNDDVAPESESETVMSVIDGDKPDNHDDDPDDTPPPRWSPGAARGEVNPFSDRPCACFLSVRFVNSATNRRPMAGIVIATGSF